MKTFDLLETKHPDLFRVVDRNGNWEYYWHKPSDTYLRGVTTILNVGYAKGAFFDEWLSRHTPDERDEILRAAGERGDKVHRAIDTILGMGAEGKLSRTSRIFNKASGVEEQLSIEEWDALLSFGRFWVAHEPILHASEASVFNTRLGYAGTADAILTLTKSCGVRTCKCADLVGKVSLWDWKTSKGIRPSYSAQTAAYACAENIGEYLPGMTGIAYTAVLRLGTAHKTTGGYELKSFDVMEGFERFMAAKSIADFEHRPFEPSDITEVPDEIKITVTAYQAPKPEEKKTSKRKAKVAQKRVRKIKSDKIAA